MKKYFNKQVCKEKKSYILNSMRKLKSLILILINQKELIKILIKMLLYKEIIIDLYMHLLKNQHLTLL